MRQINAVITNFILNGLYFESLKLSKFLFNYKYYCFYIRFEVATIRHNELYCKFTFLLLLVVHALWLPNIKFIQENPIAGLTSSFFKQPVVGISI